MNLKKSFLAAIAAFALGVSFASPGFAEDIDMLRSIPLEVKGYALGQQFPAHFHSADEIIAILNNTPVLLLHMEALRRGYHDLSEPEQNRLLSELLKRRQTDERDLQLGFDHGYAQLIYKNNKTGLFFLRKANDFFQNQFSNLAYGMAQVEADLTLEESTPEQMTTRKMDAMYRLGDAVRKDADSHQPGFWPSYIKVVDKLKPLAAYAGFSRRDFSLTYVPYGSKVVPLKTESSSLSLPLQNSTPTTTTSTLLSGNVNTSVCNPDEASSTTGIDDLNNTASAPLAQRNALFGSSNALIQFFPTEENHLYRVRVMSPAGSPLLTFKSHAIPSIVEDLDGDGTLEIVARQYQYNPLEPVLVYRYTPCGFELDKKIAEQFK